MVTSSLNHLPHRWELLRVMRVDVVFAADGHCQCNVATEKNNELIFLVLKSLIFELKVFSKP